MMQLKPMGDKRKLSRFRIGWAVLLLAGLILTGRPGAASTTEPFGDPRAVKGGKLVLHTSDFPKSFNYLINNAADAAEVFNLVYDSLMELDPNTLEYQPLIARSWRIAPDQKTFVISIDPRAQWADGKPITAADVKFTYDTIMNPKNMTSVQRLFIGRFKEPEVLDKYTVRFRAQNVHYMNLITLAGFNILPQHLFAGQDFNKAFNMQLPPGSGPYILSDLKEGRYYQLTRRNDYWADCLPHHRGTYNFAAIRYKVVSNDNIAFESFKKGEYDLFDFITPKRWVTQTKGKPFRRNWIVKQKLYNYAPRGFRGIVLNMRQPLFKDRRIRQGLFHLLNRDYIIKKLRYNQEKPLTSYFPSLYGANQANPEIRFDPDRAKRLFNAAGFDRLDKTGTLINHRNQPLAFTIFYVLEENEIYLTNYAESCKKAGVKIKLQRMSWAAMIKKMDEYKFDALVIGWTGTLFDDPEQLWHSRHRSEPGGSNLAGYQSERVDRLIDSLPPIYDAQKRIAIIKQIDRIIYDEVPYLILWDRNYSWLLYKNVFSHPKTITAKFSLDIIKYWWFDPVKVKRYQNAVRNGHSLPPEPVEIYYDKMIQ